MKIFYPAILLLLMLPASGAGDQLSNDGFPLSGLSESREVLTESAGKIGTAGEDPVQLKSPTWAFALAAGPMIAAPITYALIYETGWWEQIGGESFSAGQAVALYSGTAILFLGTIPAHIYVKDSLLKTVGLQLIKVARFSMMW